MSIVWNEIWKRAPFPPRIHWYAEDFLRYLIKWSPFKRHGLFLEAGAGTGRFSYRLSQERCEVVALDLSRNSIFLLQRLKKMSKGFMHVIRADIRHMPFRDCVFDVVYNEGVVEHFLKPHFVLKEMTRVLRNFGILIFSVPNKFSFHTLGRFMVTRLMSSWWRYGYERSFSENEVRHLLQSFRLKNIEVHGIGLFYGVGRYMPSALRAFLNYINIRIREKKLGTVLTEHFGFQIIGKGEKWGA